MCASLSAAAAATAPNWPRAAPRLGDLAACAAFIGALRIPCIADFLQCAVVSHDRCRDA